MKKNMLTYFTSASGQEERSNLIAEQIAEQIAAGGWGLWGASCNLHNTGGIIAHLWNQAHYFLLDKQVCLKAHPTDNLIIPQTKQAPALWKRRDKQMKAGTISCYQ